MCDATVYTIYIYIFAIYDIYTAYMYMITSGVFHLTMNKERHIGQFQWWNSFLAAVHHLLRCEPLRLARYRHGHTVCDCV